MFTVTHQDFLTLDSLISDNLIKEDNRYPCNIEDRFTVDDLQLPFQASMIAVELTQDQMEKWLVGLPLNYEEILPDDYDIYIAGVNKYIMIRYKLAIYVDETIKMAKLS